MDIQLQNSKNKVTVSDAVFGADYTEALVHQVVVAYMAGGRAGTQKQKTRAEVRGGGRKPYKQKGTGQARAGTIRSPLWRKGGKIFAAVPRDYSQKVNRKMYRGALRAIVSELTRQGHLVVAEEFKLAAPKTSGLLEQLGKFGATDTLIVTDDVDQNLMLSSRNLHNVDVTDVEGLDPVALLSREKVLMTQAAVKKLEKWLS
ncbi:MAG TPA: 50S ribosomal protein L4 [Candidatus Binatia bacterium]|nr:50S ribosomal protein L4 [Candidatus Binatia bacterium]